MYISRTMKNFQRVTEDSDELFGCFKNYDDFNNAFSKWLKKFIDII